MAKMPKIGIPKTPGMRTRRNAGGISSSTGGGTMKDGGFKGGSKGSGSRGRRMGSTGMQSKRGMGGAGRWHKERSISGGKRSSNGFRERM